MDRAHNHAGRPWPATRRPRGNRQSAWLYRHFQKELQAGEVWIEGPRHPCRYVPAVKFVIEAAA